MQIGYKLAAEAFSPQELIRQAVLAERAGFDLVEMSDSQGGAAEERFRSGHRTGVPSCWGQRLPYRPVDAVAHGDRLTDPGQFQDASHSPGRGNQR